VVADNLGLHGILGYTDSFSHSCACDLCFGTKEELQSVFRECDFRLRNNAYHYQTTLYFYLITKFAFNFVLYYYFIN